MGTLRLLLACTVVIGHSSPLFGFIGLNGYAVPAFFIISGFYMNLILDTTYNRPGGTWLFYSNRFLRLFPIYWSVLIMYAVVAHLPYTESQNINRYVYDASLHFSHATDGSPASLWAIIPNLLTLGSDWFRLFAADALSGTLTLLRPTTDLKVNTDVYLYLIMPPNWSLGVELVFYAIVPLLMRVRTWSLILIFLLFAGVHHLMQFWNVSWNYLPSPFNIPFFLIGMFAFRCTPQFLSGPRPLVWVAAAYPFIVGLFFQHMQGLLAPWNGWPFWGAFGLGLPALFIVTKDIKWDSEVGNLSYPVYLVHWRFAWGCLMFGWAQPIAAILLSVGTSWCLLKIIDEPVERWRRSRASIPSSQLSTFHKGQGEAAPPGSVRIVPAHHSLYSR